MLRSIKQIFLIIAILTYAFPLEAAYYKEKQLLGSVYFSQGSLELDRQGKKDLRTIAEKIKSLEEMTNRSGERLIIRLEGYADSVGDSEINFFYSMMRAGAVEAYLVKVSGIKAELYLTGFGESTVEVTEPGSGRGKDRRVDIVRIIGEGDFLKVLRMVKKPEEKVEIAAPRPEKVREPEKLPPPEKEEVAVEVKEEKAEPVEVGRVVVPKVESVLKEKKPAVEEKELEEVEKEVPEEQIIAAPELLPEDLNRKGVELIKVNSLDGAIKAFKKALELDPDHSGARFNLAFAYQRLERYEEAEGAYRDVIEREDLMRAHLMLGILYQKQGRNDLAIAEFEEVLRREPTNAMAKGRLESLKPEKVEEKVEEKKPEVEKEVPEEQIVTAPELLPEDLNRKGVELIKVNSLDGAIKAFKKALELDPDHSGARFNLAFAYQRLERYEEAEGAYRDVIEREDLMRAHLMLGILYQKQGRNDLAIAEFEEVLRREPTNAMAKGRLESLKPEKVEEILEEEIVDEEEKPEPVKEKVPPSPTPDELNREGVELVKANRLDEAIGTFKKALELDYNHIGARFNLAFAYQRMERFEEAEETCREVIEREDMTKAHLLLGVIYERQGKMALAIGEFEDVLRREPDNEAAKRHLEGLQEGKIEEEAEELDANALNKQGAGHLKKGRLDEALSAFEKALALEPGHKGASFNRAFTLQRMGKFEEAENAYTALLEVEEIPSARLMLGVIYEERGENEKAIEAYERILETDPANSRAKNRLERLREIEKSPEDLMKEGAEHLKNREYELAMAIFKRVTEKTPGDYRPHFNMGLAYLSMGRYYKALESFQRAVEINDFARAHLMLGVTYDKIGDSKSAEKQFVRVLEMEPNNEMANKYLKK